MLFGASGRLRLDGLRTTLLRGACSGLCIALVVWQSLWLLRLSQRALWRRRSLRQKLILAARDGLTLQLRAHLATQEDVAIALQPEPEWGGTTALYASCLRGHPSCAKLLIEAGADVNHANLPGDTALHIASQKGFARCVELLLAAGADASCEGASGNTPLMLACHHNRPAVAALLLGAKASPEQACRGRATPLYCCAFAGHFECARILLDAGASPELPSALLGDLMTPLACATTRGHLRVVQLLSSHGARRLSETIMNDAEEVAIMFGHADLYRWLLRSREWSPLHHVSVLTPDRARLLLRAGADVHARVETWVEAARVDVDGVPAVSDGVPETPLELARLEVAGAGPGLEAARLILLAAGGWTAESHELFPEQARAHAADVISVLYQIALDPRMAGGPPPQWFAHAVLRHLICGATPRTS